MLCPICGRPTRLLRMEQVAPGMSKHLRLCTVPTLVAHDGVEFETYEMLAGAVANRGLEMAMFASERTARGMHQRSLIRDRRLQVRQLMGTMSASKIAKKLGTTRKAVEFDIQVIEKEAREARTNQPKEPHGLSSLSSSSPSHGEDVRHHAGQP